MSRTVLAGVANVGGLGVGAGVTLAFSVDGEPVREVQTLSQLAPGGCETDEFGPEGIVGCIVTDEKDGFDPSGSFVAVNCSAD